MQRREMSGPLQLQKSSGNHKTVVGTAEGESRTGGHFEFLPHYCLEAVQGSDVGGVLGAWTGDTVQRVFQLDPGQKVLDAVSPASKVRGQPPPPVFGTLHGT